MIHPDGQIHPTSSRSRKWPKPVSAGGRGRSHSGPHWENPEPYLPETEPPRPHPLDAGPGLRLSNPRWMEARGEYGENAFASVDAEAPPSAATRVIFKVWAEWGRGQRMELPDAEGHIGQEGGAVQVGFVLELPYENGAPVAACRYRFRAKHSLSDPVTSGPLPAGPGTQPAFDGLIYYCPAREEYLLLPAEEDVRKLLAESQRIEGLRDRAMQAWENPDPGRRSEDLRALDKESQVLFGGTGNGRAKSALLELIKVGGNRRWGEAAAWTRVRAHDRNGGATCVDAYWRKASDKQVRKELDRLLSPAGGKGISPFLKSRFKAHLFAAEPKAGEMWRWSPRKDGASKAGTVSPGEASRFTFTPEAALGRYFAGWNGGEASFEPGKKQLRIGVAGSAAFAVFEGKVTLAVELPDPGGLNLLSWLGAVKFRDAYLADARRACQLKLRVAGSLSAFVGGTAQGALTLTGDFAKIPEARAGGEAYAFAGAQARFECEGSLQWAAARTGPFAALATLTGGVGASAGIGGEAAFRVEYQDGVFRFKMGAALCLGLGLKGSSLIEADVREGWAMLGHLCDCVDFHFVAVIAKEAFAAYRNYAFACFTAERHMEEGLLSEAAARVDWARHEAGDFRRWLGSRAEDLGRVKGKILSRIGERSRLRRSPPEALGQLLATLMETREAEDFQGIRYILGSCAPSEGGPARISPDHKLKWVLRYVSAIPIPEMAGPERDAKKGEALRDGIRILKDFGGADGKWRGMPGPGPDGVFIAWLEGFLAANGIQA
ncbi:MAG: hypothetical protein JF616_13845 [Fibrobacteres bacterium]|nr:hypothetical protein [Fibrobacterota bacterium]